MTRANNNHPSIAVPRALVICLIAIAQPVFAEEAAPAPAATPAAAPAPPSELIAAPPPATPESTTTLTSDSAAAPEAPAPRYPRSVIARPLTLPSGVAMLGADAVANNDVSTVGGAPIFGYGITDKLEVQVPYSFTARDFEAKGALAADVGYVIVRGALDGKLEAIARVRGGYHALEEHVTPVMLGVHAQYNFTPKIAVISGYAGTQQLRIGLQEDAMMAKPVDFSLPIALGVQPTEELYLQLDTKLAQVAIANSENLVIGADATPVSLTAVYNIINALDVQAAIGTDLNAAGDSLFYLLGARYYAGQL